MALYIGRDDVKVRLLGKVRFTESLDDENKMSYRLLDNLINEAEAHVEQDLSPRFAAPFVTDDDAPFKSLPERPTRFFIKTLCELQAVMRVLETDYGRGSVTNGEEYSKKLEQRYDDMLKRVMEKKEDGAGWKYPPLPGLKLNYFNKPADDGFAGMVLNTSSQPGNFAADRINQPEDSFQFPDMEI